MNGVTNDIFTYNPVQAPSLLSEKFKRNLLYKETAAPECAGFAICFWEMKPRRTPNETVDNIILPDGCIDLLANVNEMVVGFSGMKKTEFHYPVPTGTTAFGFRLRPGAFRELTGRPATQAMDDFLPLEQVDSSFSPGSFSVMPLERQKEALTGILLKLMDGKSPAGFIRLFESLYNEPPETAAELSKGIGYSQKQCERLFAEHYGLTPKVVLSVIRFQRALVTLTSPNAKQSDILRIEGYYDQPHMIRDVRQSIGLTPMELIRRCREDDENIQ
jgi:AraC-like DNA-binding protein